MKYEIFFNRKKTVYHYSNHLNERKSLSIPEYVFTCVYSFTWHTHTYVYIFTWNTNSNRFKDSVYIKLQSNLKYSAMNTSTQKTRLLGFHSQSKGTGVSTVHWSGSGGLLVQALQWSRWYENSPHQRILVVLCMSEH